MEYESRTTALERSVDFKLEFVNALNAQKGEGEDDKTVEEVFFDSLVVTVCGSITAAMPVRDEAKSVVNDTLSGGNLTMSVTGQTLEFAEVEPFQLPTTTAAPPEVSSTTSPMSTIAGPDDSIGGEQPPLSDGAIAAIVVVIVVVLVVIIVVVVVVTNKGKKGGEMTEDDKSPPKKAKPDKVDSEKTASTKEVEMQPLVKQEGN